MEVRIALLLALFILILHPFCLPPLGFAVRKIKFPFFSDNGRTGVLKYLYSLRPINLVPR